MGLKRAKNRFLVDVNVEPRFFGEQYDDFHKSEADLRAADSIRDYLQRKAQDEAAAREAQRLLDVRAAIGQHLDTQHATLWGRSYDLLTSRDDCIDFILDTFKAVAEHVSANDHAAMPGATG